MTRRPPTLVTAALLACLAVAGPATAEQPEMTSCRLTFQLKGWSVLYKKANGEGEVVCDNGERAKVSIRVRGGGLTVGKSEILNGSGKFSKVKRLDEVFGSYAAAAAHGGAVKSGEATAMTKGEVSLALKGTGRGFDVGIAFAKFKIKPRS